MNTIPYLKCSLIVPIYNGEKYIDRFVECLKDQSYPTDNYEVIFVNDGSTDNSAQKLCDVCEQFSNYVLINKTNGGVSSARNFGIRNSRGNYLIFADIDDCFGNDYISNLMSADLEYDLVSSGIRVERDNGQEIIKRYIPVEYMKDDAQFFSSDVMKIWGAVLCHRFKKSIIVDNGILFPEDISCSEDQIFLNIYLSKAKIIKTLDNVDYYYKWNDNSLTKQRNLKKHKEELRVIESMSEIYDPRDEKVLNAKAWIWMNCIGTYIKYYIEGLPYRQCYSLIVEMCEEEKFRELIWHIIKKETIGWKINAILIYFRQYGFLIWIRRWKR